MRSQLRDIRHVRRDGVDTCIPAVPGRGEGLSHTPSDSGSEQVAELDGGLNGGLNG